MDNKKQKQLIFTDRASRDLISKTQYKKLSKPMEQWMIKKSQLSYYDEVDDKRKEFLLKQYMEVSPIFCKKYENADFSTRSLLIDEAIEDSFLWREKFIANNQRLVASIASKFSTLLSFDDCMSEGNVGMINALKKFDISRGKKFSTYATKWIKQSMQRAFQNRGRRIRIPVYLDTQLRELKEIMDRFEVKHGKKPTFNELLKMCDYKEKDLKKRLELLETVDFEYTLNWNKSSEIDVELIDLIENLDDDAFTQVENDIYNEQFMKILKKSVSEQSLYILMAYFGFFDDKCQTLEEIAKHLNVTRDTVRYYRDLSLNNLRTNPELKKFYNNGNAYQKIKKIN